jgi:hypothetical protein
MDEHCVPSTSAALVAVAGPDRRSLAADVALDLERARRLVLRVLFGTMGGVIAGVTVGLSLAVFGFGPLLGLVFVLAATLGVSLTLATAALTGTAVDALARVHWRRVALRQYGLDASTAEQALEDARLRLQAIDLERVALRRAHGGSLLAAWIAGRDDDGAGGDDDQRSGGVGDRGADAVGEPLPGVGSFRVGRGVP